MKTAAFFFSLWSVLFVTSLYFLVTDKPPLREGQAVASLSSFRGDVQYRLKDDFQWLPVGRSQQFVEGSTLSTGKNGRAAVRLSSGRVIEISESSQIVLTVDQDPTAANEVSIFLLQGRIDVSKEKEQKVVDKPATASPFERVLRALSNPKLLQRDSAQTVALRVGKREIALGSDSTVKVESKAGGEATVLSLTGNTDVIDTETSKSVAVKPAETPLALAQAPTVAPTAAATPTPEPEMSDAEVREILKKFELKKELRNARIWDFENPAAGEAKSLSVAIDGARDFRQLAKIANSRQISVVFSAGKAKINRSVDPLGRPEKSLAFNLGEQELASLLSSGSPSVIPEKIDVRLAVRSYNVAQSSLIEEDVGSVFVGSLLRPSGSWFRVDAWMKEAQVALLREENWLLSSPRPERPPSFSLWIQGPALRGAISRVTQDLSSVEVYPNAPPRTAFHLIREGDVKMHVAGTRKTAMAISRRFRADAVFSGENASYLSEAEWIRDVEAGTLSVPSVFVLMRSGSYTIGTSVFSDAPLAINLFRGKTLGVLLGKVDDVLVLEK